MLAGVLIPWLVTAFTAFTDMPTIVTIQSLLFAFGISAFIGMVFGRYPAWNDQKIALFSREGEIL